MNLAFWTRLSRARKSSPVFQTLAHLRRHPFFRRARIDLYTATLRPVRLMVLLGQVHTVWRGKVGNRQRRQIVACQARLCTYYSYFQQFHEVREFGGEGMYEGLDTSFQDQVTFHLYRQVEQELRLKERPRPEQLASRASQIFQVLGKRWQEALRVGKDLQIIQRFAAAVSGLTLWNFLNHGGIRVYPVEGEGAYQKVLAGISHLGQKIERLEGTPEFRAVVQRGGTVKEPRELPIVRQHHDLVKEFHRILGSDLRERATFEILKKKSRHFPLVVFTMGVGHRKNYLRLVDEYLHDTSTAFVFITPPELLVNWPVLVGIPLILLMLVVLIGLLV